MLVTVKLQTLHCGFENFYMKGSESVQEYFSRISVIFNQIRTYKENNPNKNVVE